mgnify:CR=1 FL=1
MAGKRRQETGRPGRQAGPRADGRKPHGAGKPPVRGPEKETGKRAEPARKPRAAAEAPRATASEAPQRPLMRRTGDLPAGVAPVILETGATEGYSLLDTGDGLKLEKYGPLLIIRPDAQALWPKSLPDAHWARADAMFTGDTDEDGIGRWAFPKVPLGETWPMKLLGVDFLGRLTSFRHVGVFPEQIAHWQWAAERIETAKRPVRVLNLFGYTGVASLIAAKAGAEVTHVDASKKAIGWARENQALAGLEAKPIRWICDDAMKFILREERRGSRYDLILADPPKFGRGPAGEVWQLFEHLPLMLDVCRELLTAKPIGLVLTAYSIRASFYATHELMRETMRGAGGTVESGELIIREARQAGEPEGRALSTSLFSRWTPDA